MGKVLGLVLILAGIAFFYLFPADIIEILGLGKFWPAAILVIIGLVMLFKKPKPHY